MDREGAVRPQAAHRRAGRAVHAWSIGGLIGLAATLLGSQAWAQTPTITLKQAIAAAAADHPNIDRALAGQSIATAQRRGLQSAYGPTLSTEANLFVWSTETVFGTIVVRERVTWDASVTLTQPITPLWAVYHGVRAARFAEEAAAIEVSSSRRTQVRDAVVGYYRVLQARAALETAERSVEQLEAQLERLRAVVEVGAAAPSEALRLEVAVAAAQQAALRAQSDLDLARAALAFAVGGEPGSMVEAAPLEAEVLPPATMELEEATTSALAHRDELAQLGLSVQQAEIGVLAKEADYLPQVVGLAQYKHAEGSGLAAADDGFVGASLSWTLWQWGARARAVDVAEARVLQLEATQELTRRQIALQVRAAWQNVRTSVASHAVAAAALEQATEAFRIERARYEAGASTATDLLDVQAALIEAENNLNASLYQAWVNYAELSYTTGAPLGGLGEEQ